MWVMVVDGLKLVCKLIVDVLQCDLLGVEVIGCDSIEDVQQVLVQGLVDLVMILLILCDGDGLVLVWMVCEVVGQVYVLVIVVFGDVQQYLEQCCFIEYVIDYFDKVLGYEVLVIFICGYVQLQIIFGVIIFYIEDSCVVVEVIKCMFEWQQLNVLYVVSVEEVFILFIVELLGCSCYCIDLVLIDVILKGELSGCDVVQCVCVDFGYGKCCLLVLVMIGDGNLYNQIGLLQFGVNDLVFKLIEEWLLVIKVLFQLCLV